MVKKICSLLFCLQEKELKPTFLLLLLIFPVYFVSFCGGKLADGLLADCVHPKEFPLVYLFQGLGILFALPLLAFTLRKWAVYSLFLAFVAFSSLLSLCYAIYFGCCSTEISSHALFLMRTLFYLCILYIPGSFWLSIDGRYSKKEAGRIYGFFQGILLSSILCSTWIIDSTVSCRLQLSKLCYLLFFIAFAASLFGYFIRHRFVSCSSQKEDCSLSSLKQNFAINKPRQMALSPLFFIVLSAMFFNRILETAVESSYYVSFAKYVKSLSIPLEGRELYMTRFLSRIGFWVIILNIFFTACCYGRLIKRIGLRWLMMIPSFLFILFFLLKESLPPLWCGVFAFFISDGVLESVEEVNFSLVIKYFPERTKKYTRLFLESLAEGFGILLGYCSLQLFPLFRYTSAKLALSIGLLFLVIMMCHSLRKKRFCLETALQ